MPDILSFVTSGGITIISFILVLGLLVFVHELGHFVVAKRAGIRVEEFGFGYPPRMLTLFKRGETEYTINWLPLGGFVRMVGENGDNADDPQSFASKSPFWRGAVLIAGSTMNLILPIFLFAIIAMTSGVPGEETTGVRVVEVAPGSPAAEANIQPGDVIIQLEEEPVQEVRGLQALVQQFDGQEITMKLLRGEEEVDVTISPQRPAEGEPAVIGVAIDNQYERIRYNPIRAFFFGIEATIEFLGLMIQGFLELPKQMAASEGDLPVAGPVGIMRMTGEVAQRGQMESMLQFIALLSLNLAILNLLPIPALDGGRLVFVVLEILRGGKRISPEREGMVHFLGMLLLLGLIAFISVLDVQRLIMGIPVLQ